MKLEKIINSGRRTFGQALVIGSLAVSPLITGCESDSNEKKPSSLETQSEKTGYKTNEKVKKEEVIPVANKSDAFAIVYPQPEEKVDYRTTLRGVGINKKVKNYNVKIKKDKWYEQVGRLEVSNNGSWKDSPAYFGGREKYNNHIIKMNILYQDHSSDETSVRGIIRK
jgi:hypothetical protein